MKEAAPDTFFCEPFRADISVQQCLVNQARGRFEGDLSIYFKCIACDLGALYREANGGKLPRVVRNNFGHVRVAPPVGEQMPKVVIKVNDQAVTLPGGQPLTASTPAAASRISEVLVPESSIQRPCKNHPDREALFGNTLCRECKSRAYQREWMRKKRSEVKQEERRIPEIKPKLEALEKPPEVMPENLCIVCKAEPRQGKSSRCKSCLVKQLDTPKAKENRLRNIGERTRKAHAVLKRLEAGEIGTKEDLYKRIFDLVPGLEEFLEEQAMKQLRPLESEIAVRLRDSMQSEKV